MYHEYYMKKKLTIAFVALSALVISITAFYIKGHETNGLTKVEEYKVNTGCLAIMASCGECFGEVIDDQCYVNKNDLTQEQLIQMGLN